MVGSVIRVAVNEAICEPRFLLEVFATNVIKRQIHAVKSKTTRDGLNTEDVANFWIPLPSLAQQRDFLEVVESIKRSIELSKLHSRATRHLLATITKAMCDS